MDIHPNFLELASPFRAVLFDSYGVLKNHNGLIEGAVETLEALKEKGLVIRILTNDASRSRGSQAERFHELGFKEIWPDEIITSGMIARFFLQQKIRSGRVAYLGTEAAADYILDSGCEAIPVRDIHTNDYETINAFVFLDDEGFNWERDINKAVNLIRRCNIPVIVANSDRLYPVSRKDVAIATGGIAQLIELILGRKFLHFGKPDTQMFNHAFEDLNRIDSFQKSDILMVGDTLHTDILGGNKFGVKTCLTLSGNTSPSSYALAIRQTGIIPDFVCDSIGS